MKYYMLLLLNNLISIILFKQVRTRGLPDDHKGSVRVVCIEGVDNNMCCGTHVSNLYQLQVNTLFVCINSV